MKGTATRYLATTLFPIVLGAMLPGRARAAPPAFRVIVHPSNPAQSLERKFLENAFLKKITRWGNEQVIRPVDADTGSQVRNRFSEDVLRRSVAAVKSYWQQVVFSGRGVPPPELDTDEEIVAYVLKHPGAIGYISEGTALGGAKVVSVRWSGASAPSCSSSSESRRWRSSPSSS